MRQMSSARFPSSQTSERVTTGGMKIACVSSRTVPYACTSSFTSSTVQFRSGTSSRSM